MALHYMGLPVVELPVVGLPVLGLPVVGQPVVGLPVVGLPVVSSKKSFPESQIINPLLIKLLQSRWLNIGLVLFFCEFIDLGYASVKKRTWPIYSHLD